MGVIYNLVYIYYNSWQLWEIFIFIILKRWQFKDFWKVYRGKFSI